MPLEIADALRDESLVNESEAEFWQDKQSAKKASGGGGLSIEQALREPQERTERYLPPETWFGEATGSFGRGVDQLQQMAFGVGELGSSATGMDQLAGWFRKGVDQQEKDISENPASTPTYEDVDGFDSFMRYGISAVGELAPQIGESVLAAVAGAAVGTTIEPGGGTVLGGLTGFVSKQAIRNLIKGGVTAEVKDEIKDFAAGKIAREALTDGSRAALVNETKNLMGKYGAWGAIGVSSWGKETASIYNDLRHDSDVPESDRKASALVGGFIAALPDTALQGFIASKFFPGVANVPAAKLVEANKYMTQFVKTLGPQMVKIGLAESGQEYAQTFVEEAAKNYARGTDIFSMTDEQKSSFIDAAIKGGIGGGILGGAISTKGTVRLAPNPSPEVRAIESEVLTQADDLTGGEMEIKVGPMDERLSAIAKRKTEVEEMLSSPDLNPAGKTAMERELIDLQIEENQIYTDDLAESGELIAPPAAAPLAERSLAEQSLVNEEAPVVEPLKPEEKAQIQTVREPNPLERAVGHLRAFYAKQMPTGPATVAVNKTRVKQTREKIGSLVNEITQDATNPEEASLYGQTIQESFTDRDLNFMGSEDIQIRMATKGSKESTFSVHDEGTDDIVLTIPHYDDYLDSVKDLTRYSKEKTPIKPNFTNAVQKIVTHELIHIADQVAMRNQWRAEGGKVSFSIYEGREMEARGKALKEAVINDLGKHNLPQVLHKAYHQGASSTSSSREIGQEFTRMVVELARTGEINEVTAAMVQAEQEEQGNEEKGFISNFLVKWIEAIREIHKYLTNMLDPKNAPPEFVRAYDALTQVLDNYGVLTENQADQEIAYALETEDVQENSETGQEEHNEPLPVITEEGLAEESLVNEGPAPKAKKFILKNPTEKAVREWIKDRHLVGDEERTPLKARKVGDKIKIMRGQEVLGTFKPLKSGWQLNVDPDLFATTPQEAPVPSRPDKVKGKVRDDFEARLKRPAQSARPSPEQMGEATGLVYKGVMMDAILLYNDEQSGSPSFGATIAVPVDATLNDLEDHLEEVREKFTQSKEGLVNEKIDKSPARAARTKFNQEEKKLIAKVDMASNQAANATFGTISIKEAEEVLARGGIFWAGLSPLKLKRMTTTNTEAAVRAQGVINKIGGVIVTAEQLIGDITGASFNIVEDTLTGVPNPVLGALYENLEEQLKSMAVLVNPKNNPDGTLRAYSYISDLAKRIETTGRLMGSEVGGFGQIRGKMEKIWTAETARREYVEQLLQNAEKVLGKESRENMINLARELNQNFIKYGAVAASQPKIIALIRKIQKLVTGSRFSKGIRKTVIRSVEALNQVVNKAAARAAQAMSDDLDNDVRLTQIKTSIIKSMTRLPKVSGTQNEDQIFNSVLQRTVRERAEDLGLITPNPPQVRPTIEQQFAALLKNDAVYQQFAQDLYHSYLAEYGGANPSDEIRAEAEALYESVSSRSYTNGMLQSLVNEKLRELKTTFSKIVKTHYEKIKNNEQPEDPAQIIEDIRNDISDYMESQGMNDPALMQQLSTDIEEAMQDNIARARVRFYGSANTVRDFLRQLQTTVYQATTDLATHVEDFEGKFEELLVGEYGFPNNPELPIARQMASVMQQELNALVEAENIKVVQQWLDKAQINRDPKSKTKLQKSADRILQAIKLGVMQQKDVYIALQESFNLPPWNEDTVARIEQLGDMYYNSKSARQQGTARELLEREIASARGFNTSDAFVSGLYVSMLSGVSTPIKNLLGNMQSLFGFLATNPLKVPQMLRAITRVLGYEGEAFTEFRESWFTGLNIGRDGSKFVQGVSTLEVKDPYFKSARSIPQLAEAEEKAATFLNWLIRSLRGQYVGRLLVATDIFFRVIAREAAFAIRQGQVGNKEMFESSLIEAKEEMLRIGQNPDENSDMRRRQMVIAHSIYNQHRLGDIGSDGEFLVNEKRNLDWHEANQDALEATFNQEPQGLLGLFAKKAQEFTNDKPIGKFIIPFTRISANVTNQMLEWTPYGIMRYSVGHVYGDDFRKIQVVDGIENKVRNDQIMYRSLIGTATIISLMVMMGDEDEEGEPYFAIYSNGPKDPTTRKLMQQRGWKPNSFKVGGVYYSYITSPLALGFSVIGKQYDKFRDGELESPRDISMSSSAVALFQASMQQSFVASLADLARTIDSPDPEGGINRIVGRMGSVFVPNLIKQIDKAVDPSVQQADGFIASILKEIPVARHLLKPGINVAGEPIERVRGPFGIPGLDQIMTFERTGDKAFDFMGEKRLKWPGYSKSTHLNDEPLGDKYYEYIEIAGPRIKQRVQAEISNLQRLSRDAAQERVNKIASEEKEKARAELIVKYKIPPRTKRSSR